MILKENKKIRKMFIVADYAALSKLLVFIQGIVSKFLVLVQGIVSKLFVLIQGIVSK